MIKGSLSLRTILRNLEIIWKCSHYELLLTNFYSRRLHLVINRKYTWSRRLIFAVKIKRLMKIINKRHWGLVRSEKYSTRGCFHESRENFSSAMFAYSISLSFPVHKLMARINKFCECNWQTWAFFGIKMRKIIDFLFNTNLLPLSVHMNYRS